MEEYIEINGKEYRYITNYKANENLRNSFNSLAQSTFGINFEQWHKDGYWKERYIPHSLVEQDKIIANVSVNKIDFLLNGEKKRYIQLGTVMTDEVYRKQGLGRALMETVLNQWMGKCDLIYLFANDSVLNYYPKFGFTSVEEYQYSKPAKKIDHSVNIQKLNVYNVKDREYLYQQAARSNPFSKLSMVDNASLIMFYCTSFMKENIYYIQEYDTIAIADYDEDTMYLHEIFGSEKYSLDKIIGGMMRETTEKVVLGFTPKDSSTYEMKQIRQKDTTLFIRSDKGNPFQRNYMMFPVLSHA